jgi:large subunit ribosomal protein L25
LPWVAGFAFPDNLLDSYGVGKVGEAMTKAEVLNAEIREDRGTRAARRMRAAGKVPAVLYGHGQQTVSLTLPADRLTAAIRHGHRLLQLQGGVNEQALITQLQWDVWGQEVLHVDLTRVYADERVKVEVPIELRGEAPGTKSGGVLTQVLASIEVECPAASVPEKLEMNINHLEVNQALTVADLDVPQDVKPLAAADEVVVHCPEAVETPEEAVEGPAEPELIQRQSGEAEEG